MGDEQLEALQLAEKIQKEEERANRQLHHQQVQEGRYLETVTRARAAFLRALQQLAPTRLDQLRELAGTHRKALHTVAGEDWATILKMSVPTAVPDLVRDLKAWASTCNLTHTEDDWVLRTALHTLHLQERSKSSIVIVPTTALRPLRSPAAAEWTPPRFELTEAWDPGGDSETNFTKRVKAKYDHLMKCYLERVGLEALHHKFDIGYEPQGLRDGGIPSDAKNIVRYQVLSESYEGIALALAEQGRQRGTTQQAVSMGIRRYAALIGVRLRPGGKGGRPRKG